MKKSLLVFGLVVGLVSKEQSSCTTHWSDEQFEDFANIIEDLEEAIEKDLA